MRKYKVFCLLLACTALLLTACAPSAGQEKAESQDGNTVYAIELTDDLGKQIQMESPAQRIISLYSAHTENLYSLGLDEEIIGVGTADAYPYPAVQKMRYSYRSDPEKVIAADPDLVLIRPFIQKSYPDFVSMLENAGITVVCLYPEKFDQFDDYIMDLALLTGKTDVAVSLLEEFHKNVDAFEQLTAGIEPKACVFFEATETEYRTVAPDSTPARAISIAGGVNVASDAVALHEGTSIASYGIERILENADIIDVYVSQRGAMNAGGNLHSISIRPGFDTLKAVKDGRVFEINEKLVSSPTFRFEKGIHELARMFYPEIFDSLDEFASDVPLTRERLARMVVKYKHKPIFTPTSKYYRQDHSNYEYGAFTDVPRDGENAEFISTAVISGYMDSASTQFEPNRLVTRDELAQVLYMLVDLEMGTEVPDIEDLEDCETPRIIEIITSNQIMTLDGDAFNPSETVSETQALEAILRLSK